MEDEGNLTPRTEVMDVDGDIHPEGSYDEKSLSISESGMLDKMPPEKHSDDEKDGDLFKRMSKNRCSGVVLKKFPRCCIFLVGVVIPLFVLIFLSLFFGIILAALEAEGEVESNDDILATRFLARRAQDLVTSMTVSAPRVCLHGYLTGMNATPFSDALIDLIARPAEEFKTENPDLLGLYNETNMTELYEFLVECGNSSRSFADEEARAAVGGSVSELSFNWIRCYEGANNLKVDISGDILRSQERNPRLQREFYERVWRSDFDRLYAQYRKEENAVTLAESLKASTRALEDASGGDSCYLNGSGSAWFWFTIQTTIGYGNQAPVSQGGRALVYTAGFVCILAFGGVLATAGSIMQALLDYSVRHRKYLAFLSKPFAGCVFWGFLWYAWMLLIAVVTQRWKDIRLSEDMSLRDGYWFSYMSTTTVGLGDIFLEPEVIVGIDLLYFPLIILVGFTFLAAFLGKLSSIFTSYMEGGKRSFVDSVLGQMNDETSSDT